MKNRLQMRGSDTPHHEVIPSNSDKQNRFLKIIATAIRELACSNYKSALPARQRIFVNYCRLAFAALISSLIFQYFLKDMLLSTGVSGVGLMVDNIIKLHTSFNNRYESNSILYLLFFGLNIPFFIYAIKSKINRKFIMNTFIFLTIMMIWGLFLPSPNSHSRVFSWISAIHKDVETAIIANLNNQSTQNYDFVWKILMLAVIAGFMKAAALFIVYGSSATTGGTDFIAFKYAVGKRHNFAVLIGAFNIFVVIFVLFFTYMFNTKYNFRAHQNIVTYYTSFKTLSTIVYVLTFTIIINFIYPINQKLYIGIVSRKKVTDFYRYFIHSNTINYSHSFTILQSPGLLNYTSGKQHTFITISTLFEYDLLKVHIRKIDPKAFVYIIKVSKIIGKYNEVLL